MRVAGFDWDAGNITKCRKHGVSLSEIEQVFHNTPSIFPDTKHSHSEIRHLAIGINGDGRYIFLAFTYRYKGGERLIRVISARYMHDKEIDYYKQLSGTHDKN